MASQSPSSDLTIRVLGRLVTPTRPERDQIDKILAVIVEILGSLLKLLADSHTAQSLRREGNGKSKQPTPADIGDIASTVEGAQEALGGPELDAVQIQTIRLELERQSSMVRQAFEQRSMDFTPGPVGQAAGHVVTGGILAGLLDVVSAFDELLDILSHVTQAEDFRHGDT